ncbi:hypothetical protein CHUAL_005317 [Chamberlinius hualienensis]
MRLRILIEIQYISQKSFAYRKCSNPKSRYNTFINHSKAFKCFDGTTAQCVAAVFQLCNAPTTNHWKKGAKVNENCNSIPKYTAIASFSGNGGTTYIGSKGHAAVFLSCLPGGAIRVADQWCGHKFNERTMSKPCTARIKPYANCADYYYTIEW